MHSSICFKDSREFLCQFLEFFVSFFIAPFSSVLCSTNYSCFSLWTLISVSSNQQEHCILLGLFFAILWSRKCLQAANWDSHRDSFIYFHFFKDHSPILPVFYSLEAIVSYILCRYVFTVDRYSNTSSSTVTRSRSEFPIHFYFPLMLPSETYPKTVFYSLLCILLFFFLSPPSSAYHLPKYLAFKS